ncbi:hypothetical protein [Rhodococcus erythropolis]|uniref:hypothetical protein n=1 Tax=Rhodococcus erythropolis TaxID=1833 RepID=UPI003013C191
MTDLADLPTSSGADDVAALPQLQLVDTNGVLLIDAETAGITPDLVRGFCRDGARETV